MSFPVAYAPIYVHPVPENHRFPMEKYSLLPEQLLFEGTVTESNFFIPQPLDDELILTTHENSYLTRLKNLELSKAEIRAIGFPLSMPLIEREICIAGGSVQAARYAQEFGIGMNIAGGTHHAFFNRGEGFCILNDLAITANYLLKAKLSKKILVVDLDVHQGNGTASIFANDPSVWTLSIHGEKNFPFRKVKSDLDVGLPDGCTDEPYLEALEEALSQLQDRCAPDLVFYLAGADPHEGDRLGRLSLSFEGMKERDRCVLAWAQARRIPLAMAMAGGYGKQIEDTVEVQMNTFAQALAAWQGWQNHV